MRHTSPFHAPSSMAPRSLAPACSRTAAVVQAMAFLTIVARATAAAPSNPVLQVYFSYACNDNDVTASASEAANATALGYTYAAPANGVVNATGGGGFLPLLRYVKVNGTARDTMSVASAEGIAFAKANNYILLGTDGYVQVGGAVRRCTAPRLILQLHAPATSAVNPAHQKHTWSNPRHDVSVSACHAKYPG